MKQHDWQEVTGTHFTITLHSSLIIWLSACRTPQDNTTGKKSQARTYPDLLKDEHDEALFDYYCTSQIVTIDIKTGAVSKVCVGRRFERVQVWARFAPGPANDELGCPLQSVALPRPDEIPLVRTTPDAWTTTPDALHTTPDALYATSDAAHTMPDALHTTLDAFRLIPHVCTLALTHRQTGGTFWSAGWSGHTRSHFHAAASPVAPSCGHAMARL